MGEGMEALGLENFFTGGTLKEVSMELEGSNIREMIRWFPMRFGHALALCHLSSGQPLY